MSDPSKPGSEHPNADGDSAPGRRPQGARPGRDSRETARPTGGRPTGGQPPWQPTPGWSQRSDGLWGEEELDLVERGHRPGPIALIVVIAIIVVAGVGLGLWVWRSNSQSPAAGPTPSPSASPSASQSASPSSSTSAPPEHQGPPKPVAAADVEDPLARLGFSCYRTRSHPVLVRSCYTVVDNAAQTRVRLQVDGHHHVFAVRVASTISKRDSDASLAAFDSVRSRVAAALGAPDPGPLPDSGSGSDDASTTDLDWGRLSTTVVSTSGVAEFVRAGARVDRTARAPLAATPDKLLSDFEGAGYHCKKRHCERAVGGSTAWVDVTPLAVTLRFAGAPTPGAHKGAAGVSGAAGTVPRQQAMATFRRAVRFTIPGRGGERAVSWLGEHRSSQFQHADFGGVHLQFLYRKGVRPSLALVSASGWL